MCSYCVFKNILLLLHKQRTVGDWQPVTSHRPPTIPAHVQRGNSWLPYRPRRGTAHTARPQSSPPVSPHRPAYTKSNLRSRLAAHSLNKHLKIFKLLKRHFFWKFANKTSIICQLLVIILPLCLLFSIISSRQSEYPLIRNRKRSTLLSKFLFSVRLC